MWGGSIREIGRRGRATLWETGPAIRPQTGAADKASKTPAGALKLCLPTRLPKSNTIRPPHGLHSGWQR